MTAKDLIHLDKRTKEERVKIAKAGGVASGKARQKKKSMKELAQLMLNQSPNKTAINKLLKKFPELDVNEVTNKSNLLLKQIEKAETGDTKAFEVIRDTCGEKPIDKVENIDNERKFSSLTLKDGETIIELK